MRVGYVILVCFFLLSFPVHAQEYRLKQFTVEDGLPSDIIKDVTEDSLGFIWIATDDGLVKFDGLRFTTYKQALQSQFAKGLINTSSGDLLAYADLDLIAIQNHLDTVVFKSILPGARNVTDGVLWYPKNILEDDKGDLWISEPASVARWDGRSLKRYVFSDFETPIFIRSFTCFQRAGVIYAVSYLGYAWRYDERRDEFIKETILFPREVADIKKVNDQWLVAAFDGLYSIEWNGNKIRGFSRQFACETPSHINQVNDSTWFIATFLGNHYWLRHRGSVSMLEKLNQDINNINRTFTSKTGDLWLATNEGLYLAQRNLFTLLPYPGDPGFIEGIAEDVKNKFLYFTNRIQLFSAHNERTTAGGSKIIYTDPAGYFQGLAFHDGRLWASNQYSALVFENDRLLRKFDFSSEGKFIHDVFIDRQGNTWLSQANIQRIICIAPDLTVRQYPIPLKKESNLNLVREGPEGLYAAANGEDDYLFLLKPGESEFHNISLPVPFEPQADFNVVQLAFSHGAIWMATTEGLIRYDHQSIKRVFLGKFTNMAVRSVAAFDDDNILFANSFGLFLYHPATGEYWHYEESSGLPSNTVQPRGIFVDQFLKVWVGTAKGIAYSSQSINVRRKTEPPYCMEALAGGTPQRYTHGLSVPFNTFLDLTFSSISFPTNRLSMQYRFSDWDTWRDIPESHLAFASLSPGTHELEVRAKKSGPFDWSDPTRMSIIVGRPFWLQGWFFGASAILFALIAYSAYAIAATLNQKRRAFLEQLVNERTNEIKLINEELTHKNQELDRFVYSASHDLSSPLKSILGLITISRMDNPSEQQVQYLDLMERSVKKLEWFIQDVINYSRNARQPIKRQNIDFKSLVESLIDDQQFSPNFNCIRFVVDSKLDRPLYTDETRLRIVLNNLISNAIKFHDFDNRNKDLFIAVRAKETNGVVEITVEDNGKGIHQQHLEKIFDMFYRATDSVSGSGLGLYILKETLQKIGGTVSVRSALGEGTTFSISLPLHQSHDWRPAEPEITK
ncbi:MAG TPA: ATP-binding protein [Cyclobacteriaceae bacterium]|nr:ATP-binding protein [Cyclobacteriaceae bacterium]